jgi:signal transduction histidine kinase
MSRPPSPKSPAPSSAAAAEQDEAILNAGTMLAARGLFAFLWLDEDLVVRRTHGALASGISVGQPISASVAAFVGLDDELRALGDGPTSAIILPNISLDRAWQTRRLNIFAYRSPGRYPFLVLISQIISTTELEIELNQQIRARRFAEERLLEQAEEIQRANTELTRVNRDLEDFAYIISHDLQGPLRALKRAARVVAEQLTDRSTSDALVAQATRMQNMLTGLLTYAIASRSPSKPETVDTRALIDEIAARLVTPPKRIVVAGEWPAIRSHAVPLDVALRNLVDNALKHHDREDGTVTVSGQLTAQHLMITVADDGPGIASEWQAEIFEPFRKAGATAASDGHGIGLALVKRTIESVGGTLRLQTDPVRQRGTTFEIAWPLGK